MSVSAMWGNLTPRNVENSDTEAVAQHNRREQRQYIGVFWRDTLKVAKNFLGPKMPLSAFWQRLNFGETLLEEVEEVLGYLVAKHFLGPEMPLSTFFKRLVIARHFQRKQRKCLATW